MKVSLKSTWLRFLIISIILFCGLTWYATQHVLPYTMLKPNRRSIESEPRFALGTTPDFFGLKYEVLNFQTYDSLRMMGYHIKADSTRGTIILLHGIGDSKEGFYDLSADFNAWGFDCVVFDLRAHGKSDGLYCTYGSKEKYDVHSLTMLMKERGLKEPFGIFGNSLGGAIALQAMAVCPDLKFGIIESTFHNLKDVVMEYAEDIMHFKSEWLADVVLSRSSEIAGFDPFAVSPSNAALTITSPVFVSHGANDHKIPISFGKKNFDSLKGPKEFVDVPDAGHLDLRRKGGLEYENKMRRFLIEATAK
jgi:pimeloyl-ACP methyl ester carboxylesterase